MQFFNCPSDASLLEVAGRLDSLANRGCRLGQLLDAIQNPTRFSNAAFQFY
jgi:hypothetical protein